jgi:hypothetical protein
MESAQFRNVRSHATTWLSSDWLVRSILNNFERREQLSSDLVPVKREMQCVDYLRKKRGEALPFIDPTLSLEDLPSL